MKRSNLFCVCLINEHQAPAYMIQDTKGKERVHALDFVVRHHRCEHGVIFRLSNGVVQVEKLFFSLFFFFSR